MVVRRSSPRTHLDLEAFPGHVQVALAEVARAAREGVLALSVACGLQVVTAMLAADVTRVCGPKGKHDRDRVAYRHGTEPRQVPLGGALVKTDPPRARTTDGREVTLPTWEVFSSRDLLSEIALGRMLAGLSARRYRAGAEPVGEIELRGTSRSAISRRFRRATEAKLVELFGRDLSGLDLLAVFIDGMHVGEHRIVVALGVDEQGRKHPLGLWEGTTENTAVCRALVQNLIDRGLPADRAMLFVTDGGKAIRKVIRGTWGELALPQRCRNHKLENITSHLPERELTFIARKIRAAWKNPDAAAAEPLWRATGRSISCATSCRSSATAPHRLLPRGLLRPQRPTLRGARAAPREQSGRSLRRSQEHTSPCTPESRACLLRIQVAQQSHSPVSDVKADWWPGRAARRMPRW
jgi:hypothetical protein